MIRAILLDLGKVIVPFDFSIGYREMERRCGLTVEGIRERIRGTGLVPRFETGEIEPHDFVERLCAALEAPMSYEEFCRIWSSIFSKETLIPDAFLKALKASYRLILVSNTNAIHFEMIRETYPLLRHFDAFILSFEVGAMKPSPIFFRLRLRPPDVRPKSAFLRTTSGSTWRRRRHAESTRCRLKASRSWCARWRSGEFMPKPRIFDRLH